jgi:M6 family metalloprotease-like protein
VKTKALTGPAAGPILGSLPRRSSRRDHPELSESSRLINGAPCCCEARPAKELAIPTIPRARPSRRGGWSVLPAVLALLTLPSLTEGQLPRPIASDGTDVFPPAVIAGLNARPLIPLEFSKGWLAKAEQVRQRRAELQATGALDGMELWQVAAAGAALTGVLRVPVIPILYDDVKEPFPVAVLQERLFGASRGDTLSYADYWHEVSGGLLRVEGRVLPWVRVPRRAGYYLAGADYGWARFGRMAELRAEALKRADALIDWGQFDNDGPDGIPNSGDDDGHVDFVAFVYATKCESDWRAGSIWPHRGAMPPFETNDAAVGGGRIKIADYVILPVQEPGTCSPLHIGVLAHETGHAFGLPDLYDYDGSSQGIGAWGLMGTGSHSARHSPAHLSAWEKEQLGWVRVDWLRQDTVGLIIPPVARDRTIYRYDVQGGRGEYALLENRQRIGSDRHLPGTGLLLWRVDPEQGELGAWNGDERRAAVMLQEADGRNDLARGNSADAGDPFPGATRRRAVALPQPATLALAGIREVDRQIHVDVSIGDRQAVLVADPGVVRLTVFPSERAEGQVVIRRVETAAAAGPEGQAGAATDTAPPRDWTARGSAGWLRLERAGDTLRVAVEPGGLAAGVYLDTIRLSETGSRATAGQIVVRLSVATPGGPEIIATGLPWGWGLASRQGQIFQASYGWDPLGLRPRPRLLHLWAGQPHPETKARLPAEALYAPVAGADGTVHVLARAQGANYLYRVAADGSAEAIASRFGDAPAYGAAPLPDGSILVADWDGHLYRVTQDGSVAEWGKLNARVYQISTAPDGTLFAASFTGDVIRVDPDGRAVVLPTGFGPGRLVAVAADEEGAVYAGERGGEGRILRFGPDGRVQVVTRLPNAEFYGLTVDARFLYALDLQHRQVLRVPVGALPPVLASTLYPGSAAGR